MARYHGGNASITFQGQTIPATSVTSPPGAAKTSIVDCQVLGTVTFSVTDKSFPAFYWYLYALTHFSRD